MDNLFKPLPTDPNQVEIIRPELKLWQFEQIAEGLRDVSAVNYATEQDLKGLEEKYGFNLGVLV